jgi:hypothetical protein
LATGLMREFLLHDPISPGSLSPVLYGYDVIRLRMRMRVGWRM